MKKIKYFIVSIAIGFFLTLPSCDEDKWLTEEPMDFYSPANSYQTTAQFRQSLNFIYDLIRGLYWSVGDQTTAMYLGDIAYGGTDFPDLKFNNFNTFFTPNTTNSRYFWSRAYSAITNANIIIGRLEEASSVGTSDKELIKGEALFFRAYFYNFLGNLFGGVPIILEESQAPRRDYVRATRDEVYDQARIDLEEAITLLQDITEAKDGVISIQAAQHLLTEVYINLGDYPSAIASASAVINHPSMSLMTSRFGTRASYTGDPYWDLFQEGNQNRSTGNTETILALQYEYQNTGSSYSSTMLRYILPFYTGGSSEATSGGTTVSFKDFTAEKGGRGIGVIHPTFYFFNQLWGDDFDNDYRNSSYMIVRDFKIDNPDAAGYDQWLVEDGWLRASDTIRMFYPFVMKFSRVGYFPEDSYSKNADGSYKETALGEHPLINQNNSCNYSFKDEYLYRLAGTYLLRAEAYLGNNQKDLAADDLNAIRNRANATPITASDVDIDFILDEQMRELYFEDFRIPTLCRLGKLVERARAYNPTGYNVGDHQNLLPIPYSEIERNIFATLEQNPGYEGF